MKLKKLSLFLLANIAGLSLMAEGYQINSQSARQVGMGHLGTALKLGGESMLFNPAGLSFMNGKVDASLGMTAIFSTIKYTNVAGDYSTKTDNPMGKPIFGYLGFKITDKIFTGISITNPAGNSLYWEDNWRGSQLAQNISLAAFSVQPTISYKFSDKLSIGAGFMIDFGDFEMNKGLLPVGALMSYINYMPNETYKNIIRNTATISPISLNIKGNAKPRYGYNLGILYSPNDNWSFGISYRSKVMMKVNNGDATINYGTADLKTVFAALSAVSPTIAAGIALDGQKFTAELPIPSNLNFGAAYKINKDLLVSAELQYVGWKAYDTLIFRFKTMTSKSVKKFQNSMIYRIGGEYKTCDKMKVRLGFIYDTTPIDKMHYSAETPGANKFSITCGITYNPIKNLAIDFGFQYLNGEKTRGSTPQAAPLTAFVGDYKANALLPALGLHFNF